MSDFRCVYCKNRAQDAELECARLRTEAAEWERKYVEYVKASDASTAEDVREQVRLAERVVELEEKLAKYEVASKAVAVENLRDFASLRTEVERLTRERSEVADRLGCEPTHEDMLRSIRRIEFKPEGDNHHNAALCPYCSPDGLTLKRERDSLRTTVDALTGEEMRVKIYEAIRGALPISVRCPPQAADAVLALLRERAAKEKP